MTITVSREVENSILAAVQSGQFPSVDEAVATAWRAFALQQPITQESSAQPKRKPVWERIQDLTADVPDEEWNKLPTDLAEQHNHYLYGTPKRPTA
jgi:Arc/MetJ-type ribon-helix-helix transcriptional regulator